MRKPERRKLRGWSYSAWQSLHDCPFRFEQGYLLGIRGPTPPNMQRGNDLHKKQELYLRNDLKELPREFKTFFDHYAALKAMSPMIEQFWGVDEKFKPYFANVRRGERSWCVMKMDAAVLPNRQHPRLWMQDLKSGREYGDTHEGQAEIYACIGSAHYENKGVDVEFWYIDQGYPVALSYKPSLIKDLTEKWIDRGHDVMTERKRYDQTPSVKACKWCHLKTSEGGPCAAWKAVL